MERRTGGRIFPEMVDECRKSKTGVRKENEDGEGNGGEVSKRGADGPAPSAAEKWKMPEVMMTHSVKHPEAESVS